MAFVLSRFVLLVPGPFPAVWMDRQLRSGIIVVPLDCQPPFTVARDLADAVAALKAREPRSDSDDLRQALIDSMQRNVEVDEPEVVVAPMLPPTMRVTLGSRSASFRDPTGVRWKIAADAERLTRGHVVHRSCRPQRQESVMSIKTMDDLFVATLKDIYYAEKQILKALPGMVKKANGKDLKKALETHRQETEGQVERLDQVFKMLEVPARGKKCEAIEGIIDEAKEHIEEIEDAQVLDAGMISSAQAVEHYEICRYGTLIEWARDLGHNDAINLLRQNLEEEKNADRLLSQIAKSSVNPKAEAAE